MESRPNLSCNAVGLTMRVKPTEEMLATITVRRGVYDARRLRSQRDVIRDVMLAAADCDAWLTLGELRALTHYGEASISAQLRHLRKFDNGAYDVAKRRREGVAVGRPVADGRSDFMWEYRIAKPAPAERVEHVEHVDDGAVIPSAARNLSVKQFSGV